MAASCCRRSAGIISPGCWRTPARGGVHHADHQRLQALPQYTLAPDRVIWGHDNRGVMLRVLGGAGDAATRIENRVGEPAANPYLYMASQIVCGLDGIERKLDPGPSADTPYETKAALLPKSLREALIALHDDPFFRQAWARGSSTITFTSRRPRSRATRRK